MPFTVEVTTRIRRSFPWETRASLSLQNEAPWMILRSFPPGDIEESWREFLRRIERPSYYLAPEFFREKHLSRRRPFAVLAIRGSEVRAVLTGMHSRGVTVSGLTCRAQICAVEPGDDEAVSALVTGFLAEAGSYDLIEICSWTPLAPAENIGFRVRQVDGTVLLDLTQPTEELFRQLDSNRRRNVRHAIRSGLEFAEITSAEEFFAYYRDVYSNWRNTNRKTILEGEATFEGFERRFRPNDNRKLFIARFKGNAIAGAFLLFYRGGLAEFGAANSLDEYLRMRPNDFVQWKMIEWAKSEGFCAYSMGAAGEFHRKFGGTVIPAFHYSLDRTFLRKHTIKMMLRALARTTVRQARRVGIARKWRKP